MWDNTMPFKQCAVDIESHVLHVLLDTVLLLFLQLAMAAGRLCAKQLLTQTPPPSVSGAPTPPLGPCTPADSPEPKQLAEKVGLL